MRLRDRIGKLEGGMPEGCAHCIAWGPRVVVVNDHEIAEDQPLPVPARCPRCGREPLTIDVIYEDCSLNVA